MEHSGEVHVEDLNMATKVNLREQLKRRIVLAFNPDPSITGDRWRGLSSQFVLVTIAALLYFGVRMVTSDKAAVAFSNARELLHFERMVGIDWEIGAQALMGGSQATATVFNWIYIWLHWPVILGALAYLFIYRRRHYVLFRNALFVSGAIGLAFFALFPVAPPRLLDPVAFWDTVTDLSTSYQLLQPPSIVNKYAALPSFHVGWNLLAGLIVFQSTRFVPVRIFAIASPTLMTLAVVFTANHYVIDVVAGMALSMIGLGGALVIRRMTRGRDFGLRPMTQTASLAR